MRLGCVMGRSTLMPHQGMAHPTLLRARGGSGCACGSHAGRPLPVRPVAGFVPRLVLTRWIRGTPRNKGGGSFADNVPLAHPVRVFPGITWLRSVTVAGDRVGQVRGLPRATDR